MTMQTLSQILESYILLRDLKPSTVKWYRRVVKILCGWHGQDPTGEAITAELLSRFLFDKQQAGATTYYLRSLRHALLAILGERINPRAVRRVRLERLEPKSLTVKDVAKMIRTVQKVFAKQRKSARLKFKIGYYERIIAFGFHTGLSKVDLERLTIDDFLEDGTLVFSRSKTGKDVVAWVPPAILEGMPAKGPLFPRRWSDEQFRKDFRRILKAAKLEGTFKIMRSTSGTQADIRTGGKGHEHLGNTRRVFETHYLDRKQVHRKPAVLPQVYLARTVLAGGGA